MSKRAASRSPSPPTKLLRSLNPEKDTSVTCTLPPTCHRQAAVLPDAQAMDRHYRTYHTHVCQSEGCFCVFPDERMLELHFAECHDPIVAIRKERGEKTFVCFVPTCVRTFATPATRRMHLIDAHHYPKEYFFAVTNKGIGGLLEKWGEGVSLVRPSWKPRSGQQSQDDAVVNAVPDLSKGPLSSPPSSISPDQPSPIRELHFGTSSSEVMFEPPSDPATGVIDSKSIPSRTNATTDMTFGSTDRRKRPAKGASPGISHTHSMDKSSSNPLQGDSAPAGSKSINPSSNASLAASSSAPGSVPERPSIPPRRSHSKKAIDVDELASALSAVSLVPRSIRFGRGTAQPGFVRRPQGRSALVRGAIQHGDGPVADIPMADEGAT